MSQTKAQLIEGSSAQDIVADDVQISSLNGGPLSGTRNRIINGDMRIDQRNAGASVTINTTANVFALDRWAAYGQSTDGVFTVQQSTSTPPAGFSHFLRTTVTTADASIGATQTYGLRHVIEGNNISDLAFGSASAKQITLSFWVRSSLTGTFGGSIANDTSARFYVFSYSISAANTWEYKTITLTGDTSGTWETGISAGIKLFFNLGAGSSSSGTAGSWGSTAYYGVTGGVNLIGTLNATLDITGVQLETGSAATPFERRSYGQELVLCQRYFCKSFNQSTKPAQNTGDFNGAISSLTGSTAFNGNALVNWRYPVQMRAAPAIGLFTPGTNTSFTACFTDSGNGYVAATATNVGESACIIYSSGGAANVNAYAYIQATASIEL